MIFDPGNILTAVSIIVATVLGFLAYYQGRRASRSEHTFDVLLARFTGDYVATMHRRAWDWVESNEPSPNGDARHPELAEILNLYEFIALAARRGILDPDMIFEIRSNNMITFYEYFLPYIQGVRQRLKRKTIYEHLEWYVEDYAKPRRLARTKS
jgi:hypothetical protein